MFSFSNFNPKLPARLKVVFARAITRYFTCLLLYETFWLFCGAKRQHKKMLEWRRRREKRNVFIMRKSNEISLFFARSLWVFSLDNEIRSTTTLLDIPEISLNLVHVNPVGNWNSKPPWSHGQLLLLLTTTKSNWNREKGENSLDFWGTGAKCWAWYLTHAWWCDANLSNHADRSRGDDSI